MIKYFKTKPKTSPITEGAVNPHGLTGGVFGTDKDEDLDRLNDNRPA
ncbi:MAG: hypothetical protein J6C53_04240 [Clostridia bacterium]|nr:hypothetical protein [Clostridia bacterium]